MLWDCAVCATQGIAWSVGTCPICATPRPAGKTPFAPAEPHRSVRLRAELQDEDGEQKSPGRGGNSGQSARKRSGSTNSPSQEPT